LSAPTILCAVALAAAAAPAAATRRRRRPAAGRRAAERSAKAGFMYKFLGYVEFPHASAIRRRC
jgi:hypothetical protein